MYSTGRGERHLRCIIWLSQEEASQLIDYATAHNHEHGKAARLLILEGLSRWHKRKARRSSGASHERR